MSYRRHVVNILACLMVMASNVRAQNSAPLRGVKTIQVLPTIVPNPDKVKDAAAPNLVEDILRNALRAANVQIGEAPIRAHIVLDEFSSGNMAKRALVGFSGLSAIKGRLVLQDDEGKEIANVPIHVRGNLSLSSYQGNSTQRRQAVANFEQKVREEIEALGAHEPPAATSSPNGQTILAAGTWVNLRTTRALSSKQVEPGEQVELEVVRDVEAGSLLVIPRHTRVTGTVSSVQPARRLMRGGDLVLEPSSAKTITGETVVLGGKRSVEGGPTADQKFQAVMEGRIILSWLPLVMKGEEATLPKGTMINTFVNRDVSLDTARLRDAAAILEQKNAADRAEARTGKAAVHLYGKGYGGKCTIALDGNPLIRLQGNRFFNLQLPPGAHKFHCQDHDLAIDAKPDNDYYIRLDGHAGFWRVRMLPVAVPEETGEDEIYPLSAIDSKDILNPAFAAQTTSLKQQAGDD